MPGRRRKTRPRKRPGRSRTRRRGGRTFAWRSPATISATYPARVATWCREFTFTNDGTAPLVVTRVITSCSCLKASFPKRPVPPGGQGVIRITYEPHKSEPGVFNKVIQVYSNSVDGRDVITVQGNSIDTPPRKIKTDKVKVKYK